MPKNRNSDTPDYSIRRRFFNEIGEPLEWQDSGQGVFDLATVQKQIRMLCQCSRKVEIELVKDGKLLGYNGEETGKTIIYEKR
jgi:hypothetical protein